MQYMNAMKDNFKELIAIKEKYGLEHAEITDCMNSMDSFKVTSPVIGNFSTGKSTMLNAVLGKQMLSVDIVPETAVPTEICYGENRVIHYYEDKITEYSIDDLPLKDLNIRNTDLLRIEYDCEFLKRIPTVKLVDLPGFDTNIELHNKAIDQYLPNSLAYILAVASDEPVLKESMTEFLKELKLFHVPVYVVITKSKRLVDTDLEACKKLIVKLVGDILETSDVKCACVESVGEVEVEEVKKFLLEIQSNTADIFKRKYQQLLRKSAKYVEVYLMDRIDKKDLSTSELEHEREKLEKQIKDVLSHVDREKNAFETQLDECIKAVRQRLKQDMEETVDVLSVLIRNGGDVTGRLNGIVRNAIAISVKAEFEPRLQMYLENIGEVAMIESAIPENMQIEINRQFATSVAENVVKRAAPFLLAAAGAFLLNPLMAVVGAALGTFADVAINISSDRKKNRQAVKTAKELVDRISVEASDVVEKGMRNYMDKVDVEIKNKVMKQKNVLEKSLNDINQELDLEQSLKEQEIKNLKDDLFTVRSLMNAAV